jgi:predicted DNA-binding antitoxin AbrB/MazE fold protein
MLCFGYQFSVFGRLGMNQTITAIYANGVLRPLTPLELEDQAQVELEVRSVKSAETAPAEERRRIIEALAQAGLLANAPALYPISEEPVSEEEEEELAQIFAGEKPLSEIIIEERQEGW